MMDVGIPMAIHWGLVRGGLEPSHPSLNGERACRLQILICRPGGWGQTEESATSGRGFMEHHLLQHIRGVR
jgi:hypothetical protein